MVKYFAKNKIFNYELRKIKVWMLWIILSTNSIHYVRLQGSCGLTINESLWLMEEKVSTFPVSYLDKYLQKIL